MNSLYAIRRASEIALLKNDSVSKFDPTVAITSNNLPLLSSRKVEMPITFRLVCHFIVPRKRSIAPDPVLDIESIF